MGKCHEFGCQIEEGCAHPMEAGHDACSCLECGVVCRGQFPGCPDVWARGPRQITVDAVEVVANGSPQAVATAEAPNGAPPPRRISLSRTRAAAAAASVPVPQPNGADQRVSEEFEWLREAFHALHEELQGLVDDLTQQQALLAEVIEGRQADLRMALVAESLPDMVRETMTESLAAQQEVLARPFLEAAEALRTAAAESTRQAEERIEAAAQELRDAAEETSRRSESRIEALRQDLEALALSLPSPAPARRKKAPAHPPKTSSTASQRTRPSRSSLGS